MRRRILLHLIWDYTVCLCPKNRTPGFYGLTFMHRTLERFLMIKLNSCKPSVPFLGHMQTVQSHADHMPQNVVSDQGLHCLHTGISIKNE